MILCYNHLERLNRKINGLWLCVIIKSPSHLGRINGLMINSHLHPFHLSVLSLEVGAMQDTNTKNNALCQWKMGVGMALQIQIWNTNTKYRVLWCRHWAESGSVGWRRSQSAAASRAGRSVLIVPQLNNWSRGSIFEDSQLLKIQSVAWKNWVLTEGTAQTW